MRTQPLNLTHAITTAQYLPILLCMFILLNTTSCMYCSSTTTYEMLGMQDIPNRYGDLSSEQGTMNL
jgi:hypothetical protein